MEFSWNTSTKCTEKPQSSISKNPFSDVPSFSKINKNQQIGNQCCLPPLSHKISLRDTSFHISLNSLGFYLSPEYLLNFFWIVHSTMCGKNFSVYGINNALKLWIFTYAPVSDSKLEVEFFENVFPPRQKGWMEETMICFIKIQSGKVKMTWNISLFIFCMIYSFSKCDAFTVLWVISIK